MRAPARLTALVASLFWIPAASSAQLPRCSDPGPHHYWLRFSSEGVAHFAHLVMSGCTGTMYVRFYDENVQRPAVVRQSMQIVASPHGVLVSGSQPVDSSTGIPYRTYLADQLLFRLLPDGTVQIENCDRPEECSPADQGTAIALNNRCSQTLTVAIAYADASDDSWVRRGWWNVAPGASVSTDVATFADYFFVYAYTGSFYFAGTDTFPINQQAAFAARVSDPPRSNERGIGFLRVNMGARPIIYTHAFTC